MICILAQEFGDSEHRAHGAGGPGKEGSVKQARFSLHGREFMCIDSPVKHQCTFTPALSLLVGCGSKVGLDRLFPALAAGGKVMMPLDAYPFSKRFGWLADEYGEPWQLRPMRPCDRAVLNVSAPARDCSPVCVVDGLAGRTIERRLQ